MSLAFQLAQLRHAYSHLKAGRVVNQAEFADGLIAPAIRFLEALAPIDARSGEAAEPVRSEGRKRDKAPDYRA